MNIRLATQSDVPSLANLFRQTVLTHGPEYYTPEQVAAWAATGANTAQFQAFILSVTTFVVVDDSDDSTILGFAGIAKNGHIASAYVHCDRIHQGIGSVLMQQVLDYARQETIERLYAEASHFSLGLFKKFGFSLYDTEIVERHGVTFERYLVERYSGESIPTK